MRRYIFLILSVIIARQGVAQIQASSIQFRIKNLGFTITGTLGGLAGSIRFDPAKPEEAAVEVTVDAATINTDNAMRDDHLRGESYFNVQRYPQMRLVATRISPAKRSSYLFTGQLTIKDHSKEISFPFTATPTNGSHRFQGSFTINRKDFDVGGFSTISDQLEVLLDVTAK